MLYELDNSHFIKNLYDSVPNLNEVKITKIEVIDEGDRVNIGFELPSFPNHPPKKWILQKLNVATAEVHFFGIKELKIDVKVSLSSSNLMINKNNLITFSSSGKFSITLEAEAARIAEIKGYQDNRRE